MFRIKCAGIYKIQVGEYYYVGMSVDIFSRWTSHYTLLKMNKHHSIRLQELFNKSSMSDITFSILEYVSLTDYKRDTKLKGKGLEQAFNRYLLMKEKEWMGRFSINYSLNKDNKNFK